MIPFKNIKGADDVVQWWSMPSMIKVLGLIPNKRKKETEKFLTSSQVWLLQLMGALSADTLGVHDKKVLQFITAENFSSL
jgi:hypothetical protein